MVTLTVSIASADGISVVASPVVVVHAAICTLFAGDCPFRCRQAVLRVEELGMRARDGRPHVIIMP
jgi:hypothetical protein